MMKINLKLTLIGLTLLLIPLATSCSHSSNEISDAPAFITILQDSPHTGTFKDLHLGELLYYNLNLTEADKSWIEFYAESYEDGELADPPRMMELSTGLFLEPEHEGPFGWSVLFPNSDAAAMLMFLGDVFASNDADQSMFSLPEGGISTWNQAYAPGDTVPLHYGETLVLAAYRVNERSLHPYNLQDSAELERMIQEEKKVYLLKINLEENPPDH
ncbi:hypothetical protein [Paenibacillus sp. 1P07SE]|uniref:hypothetical protein n=1 Tax=Paenibacillus sp. 1P07SE TaxID=3132209 RepID=UPI0039A70351